MRRVLPCVAMVLMFAAAAEAQVIWDYGPTSGTVDGCWANEISFQAFAEEVVFATPMGLTGMDIWTCVAPTAGTVHIRIFLDDGFGAPGSVFAEWDQAPTSWVADGTNYMVSADFATVNLDPGQVYWIGMTGNAFELGQLSVLTPGDGSMAAFSGATYNGMASVGDQMFQLRGAPLVLGSIPTLNGVGAVALVLLLVSTGFILIRRLT